VKHNNRTTLGQGADSHCPRRRVKIDRRPAAEKQKDFSIGNSGQFLYSRATDRMAKVQVKPVLIAEDSDDDLYLMRRAFSRAALLNPIIAVRDGAEALAYLKGEGEFGDRNTHPLPVLILLDIKMPKTSGLEVLEWIRRQPSFKDIPVVILSASNQPKDLETARKFGADSYLVKPGSLDDLVALVKRLKKHWLITE
jgi:CheY-like chemotaxis protein